MKYLKHYSLRLSRSGAQTHTGDVARSGPLIEDPAAEDDPGKIDHPTTGEARAELGLGLPPAVEPRRGSGDGQNGTPGVQGD